MIEFDRQSLLVTADTDLPLAQLEEQVGAEGFTLNYFAPPDNSALLADALSRRLPNLYGEAFGGIDDLCLQVKLSQASGVVYANLKTPRSAAGPSLKKMAIGAGEWLGIPIQATLRIFPKPVHREYRALAFPSERELEAFETSLLRLRWGFPLRARIDAEALLPWMEGVSLLDRVLGLAWWGEDRAMESEGAALEALVHSRQGRVLELKPGKDEGALAALLHDEALARQAAGVEAAQAGLPSSHRALESFLKGGA